MQFLRGLKVIWAVAAALACSRCAAPNPVDAAGEVAVDAARDVPGDLAIDVRPDVRGDVSDACTLDADGDGHASAACGGDDCNDADASIHPGQTERCNGVDDNCDGVTDEGFATRSYYPDCDSDTFGARAMAIFRCDVPTTAPASCASGRWATNSLDCNDTNAAIRPDATETCNGVDDNCDGAIDEALATMSYYPDCDRDTYGAIVPEMRACAPPSTAPVACSSGAWATRAGDCNDAIAMVSPGVSEVCNGLDDNCDGAIDEGLTIRAYYPDCDGDGAGAPITPVMSCAAPASPPASCASGVWATSGGDCNDSIASIRPTAIEICDGVDNNCDGAIDEGLATQTWHPDCDADTYGSATAPTIDRCAIPTSGPAGCAGGTWSLRGGDCDDVRALVHPGTVEVCDGLDQNCDGSIDEGFTRQTYYADCDADGYGGTTAGVQACQIPVAPPACSPTGAWSSTHDDCADENPTWNRGTGFYVCSTGCGSDSNPLACGSSCSVCTASPGTYAACVAGACDFICAPGTFRAGTSCAPDTPPRLVRPLSTSVMSSRRPALRWELATGTDGAHVEICRDHACTMRIESRDVVGSTMTPAAPLPTGVVFWRAAARDLGGTGSAWSPVWQFSVGALSAPRDTVSGVNPDVNGDGFADVAISGGGLFVYYGSPGGLSVWPAGLAGGDPFVYIPNSVGDGLGDFVFGSSARSAVTWTTGPDSRHRITVDNCEGPYLSRMGAPLAGLGDVDGDGYGDVIAGSSFGLMLCLGNVVGTQFGPMLLPGSLSNGALANAGDVNGDGFADALFGNHPFVSSIVTLFGSATGLVTPGVSLSVPPIFPRGYFFAGAGDVNADGYGDVVAADPQSSVLYFLQGGSSGTSATPMTLNAPSGAPFFGVSVASAGDVNGDGYGDVVVGNYGHSAFVYLGSATGLGATPIALVVGTAANELAEVVAGVGDVDGDGYSDIMVGQPSGSVVLLFYGSASGPRSVPVRLWGTPGSRFGGAIVWNDRPALNTPQLLSIAAGRPT